jgi:hypothetical protein
LTEKESSRPVWWHILVVIIPHNVKEENKEWGSIYITGGNNEGTPDKLKWDDQDVLVAAALAIDTKSVSSVLFQVPN